MPIASEQIQAGMRYLKHQNRRYGAALAPIPEEDWPAPSMLGRRGIWTYPTEVWRSREFLLLVYREDSGYERLSVLRTELALDGRYRDGIDWDTLQRLKAECGRGACWAVEVFPPDGDVVNVQNMRHLFVLKQAPAYAWRQEHGND